MLPLSVKLALVAACAAAVGMLGLACGDDDGGSFAVARSDLDRVTAPEITVQERAEFQAGNTAFALDIYRELAAKEGNLFFSPHSISVALAMTYAGARGDTATEMAEALRFTLPQDTVHAGFNALDLDLAERAKVEIEGGGDASPPELSVANSTWGDREKTFLADFLDVLALHYDAGMRLVDFRNEPEAARLAINAWVEDETRERIKNLIPEGMISPATALVLANAIYFKGSWETPFVESATRDGPFTRLDGSSVQARMMNQFVEARYAEIDGVQAVELLYVGREVGMIVLLPPAGEFDRFEQGFDADFIRRLDAAWADAGVDLTLPKFEFESEFVLNQVLRELGMAAAFEGGVADFSGIDGTRDLFISAVVHKSFVAVDEKGTEAAAATAVVMDDSAPDLTATMTVDRPFAVLIRDRPTGAVLFAGRVADPS